MKLVGLTGGIGAGKSSVSSRLAARGAHVIDADAIVRELQEPGMAVFETMVERWGDGIVADDGSLDRAAVAKIVFNDPDELAAINEIVHPVMKAEMRRRMDALAETDDVVILDVALMVESKDRRNTSAVIVVDVPVETQVARLLEYRGFDEDDARARIAAQATREERLEFADFVIDNAGDEAALDAEVERCWTWIETLDQTEWPPPLTR